LIDRDGAAILRFRQLANSAPPTLPTGEGVARAGSWRSFVSDGAETA
jgi:hypothetical protein